MTNCQTVSIVGAGLMGREIAAASLRAGMTVRLSDANHDLAATAVKELVRQADARCVQPLRFVDPTAEPQLSVASNEAEIADADLIIEAVTENLAVKCEILARIEPHVQGQTVITSNSSSLSMSEISKSLQQRNRFCGLHFCHPVSQRPLAEIVYTDATSSDTLKRAKSFAASLALTSIIVRDSPGFLLNRLLVPYLNETLELLLDGAEVESLDQAAAEFGMPLGPLALFDEFGIDVAIAVGRSLYRAFPDRIVPSELLIAMYKSGRLGCKSGRGFYLSGQIDPQVKQLIQERRRSQVRLSDDIIRKRLFLPVLLEATRTLQESLADRASAIDAVLRKGLGLRGTDCGIFAWANRKGASTLLAWLQPLQSFGKRFEPTELLINAAKNQNVIDSFQNAAA